MSDVGQFKSGQVIQQIFGCLSSRKAEFFFLKISTVGESICKQRRYWTFALEFLCLEDKVQCHCLENTASAVGKQHRTKSG